jgi:hypothetical protein
MEKNYQEHDSERKGYVCFDFYSEIVPVYDSSGHKCCRLNTNVKYNKSKESNTIVTLIFDTPVSNKNEIFKLNDYFPSFKSVRLWHKANIEIIERRYNKPIDNKYFKENGFHSDVFDELIKIQT